MIRVRMLLASALLPLALPLLAGCGQKGDLRLPPAKAKTPAPAAASEPAAPQPPAPASK